MTDAEKLAMVKTILRITSSAEDDLLTTYIDAAGREILSWRYSNAEAVPDEVPAEYEMTQIQAVINAYTQSGIEGQTSSTENGITRRFEYAGMTQYIRANVIPIAGVLGR